MPRKRTTISRTAQLEQLDRAIYDLILAERRQGIPSCTVRHAYYLCLGAGVVAKDDNEYKRVGRRILDMRKRGDLPWHWIADGSRWRHPTNTFDAIDKAVDDAAESYRRNFWQDQDHIFELWAEKDAMSNVLAPVIDELQLVFYPAKGNGSWSMGYTSAMEWLGQDKSITVLYVGDFDPKGHTMQDDYRKQAEYFGVNYVEFIRLAVNYPDIEIYDLQTRTVEHTPANRTFIQYYGDQAVEVDAMPPLVLYDLIRQAVHARIDLKRWEAQQQVEALERTTYATMAPDIRKVLLGRAGAADNHP